MRLQGHWSQEEFARRCGASRATIARYESLDVAGVLPRVFRQLPAALETTMEVIEQELVVGPPAPEHQRVGLHLPTPVYVALRAKLGDDDARVHEYLTSLIEASVAPPRGKKRKK